MDGTTSSGRMRLHPALGASIALALGCAPLRPEQGTRPSVEYYEPPPPSENAASPPLSRAAAIAAPVPASAAYCSNAPGQLFSTDAWFNRSVVDAPRAADSDAVVQFLERSHRAAARFQVDFSLVLLEAQSSTPRREFTPSADHYSPDCDLAPVPVPANGRLEGERGYACERDGDCHLLVVERQECRLYEMFRADLRGGSFQGGCLAVWDLARPYPERGRGEYCTSADAAGFPIAPLLFGAEDIARGEIRHALRFVLPNSLIRRLAYVHPGTHSTKATSGPAAAPPYAASFRLKRNLDLTPFKPAARVVITALQNYGMYLADGGQVTFTAASDALSDVKWSDVGFGPHDLKALRWTDFEVVDTGEPRTWRASCTRQPLTR